MKIPKDIDDVRTLFNTLRKSVQILYTPKPKPSKTIADARASLRKKRHEAEIQLAQEKAATKQRALARQSLDKQREDLDKQAEVLNEQDVSSHAATQALSKHLKRLNECEENINQKTLQLLENARQRASFEKEIGRYDPLSPIPSVVRSPYRILEQKIETLLKEDRSLLKEIEDLVLITDKSSLAVQKHIRAHLENMPSFQGTSHVNQDSSVSIDTEERLARVRQFMYFFEKVYVGGNRALQAYELLKPLAGPLLTAAGLVVSDISPDDLWTATQDYIISCDAGIGESFPTGVAGLSDELPVKLTLEEEREIEERGIHESAKASAKSLLAETPQPSFSQPSSLPQIAEKKK